MTFRIAARIIAAIFVVLFVVLGFFPASYAPTYGVAASDAVQFITQRAAPMFIGPAVILWVASTAERTPLRDAVAIAVALQCLGIAITGLIAFFQGIASPVILAAAVGECAMAAALWLTRKN